MGGCGRDAPFAYTVLTATSEPVCGAVRCGRSVGRSCIDVLLLQSSYSDATVKHIVILRVLTAPLCTASAVRCGAVRSWAVVQTRTLERWNKNPGPPAPVEPRAGPTGRHKMADLLRARLGAP